MRKKKQSNQRKQMKVTMNNTVNIVGAGLAAQITDIFLSTEFEGGRHQRRIDKITAIEENR